MIMMLRGMMIINETVVKEKIMKIMMIMMKYNFNIEK